MCVGTLLSGWFLTDWLSKWFSVVSEQDKSAKFEIISRDAELDIRKALPFCMKAGSRLTSSASVSEMPKFFHVIVLQQCFFLRGLANLEVHPRDWLKLASGTPVVANTGVGDLGEIITKNRVGVIVNSDSKQDLLSAYHELNLLLKDEKLPMRCRKTAESIFSLNAAVCKYSEIYKSLSQLENKCAD